MRRAWIGERGIMDHWKKPSIKCYIAIRYFRYHDYDTVGNRSSERQNKGCIFRFFASFSGTPVSLIRLVAPSFAPKAAAFRRRRAV